jgi:hypothetical protein
LLDQIKKTQLVEESLVQWKHLPAHEATWEPINKLQEMFLNLDFEDKYPIDRGGIDRL